IQSPRSRGLNCTAGCDRGLWIGGAMIFAIALALRLWNLGEFEPPVFDEVYFPRFAENYLDGERLFDAHPPLGKYFIALGILIFGRNPIGYRIATALFGALIPVLVTGLLYRLTYRRGLALLGGLLMLSDGLFLVESRFGLMNVFLVAFGLLAQIFLLVGLERRGGARTLLLSCSGAMLGASER
ncbi:MAG: phospholipid carrier-dependent glycosyltransferase, partial [Cyanobacteria bacterium J06639_1]